MRKPCCFLVAFFVLLQFLSKSPTNNNAFILCLLVTTMLYILNHNYSSQILVNAWVSLVALRYKFECHMQIRLLKASKTPEGKIHSYSQEKSKSVQHPTLLTTPCASLALTKAIAQLRTGCPKLSIQTGRTERAPVPIQSRVCPHCPNNLGNNRYSLLHCNKTSQDKDHWFLALTNFCCLFV